MQLYLILKTNKCVKLRKKHFKSNNSPNLTLQAEYNVNNGFFALYKADIQIS